MSNEAIKQTYNEVEITYSEATNEWEFVLRGRNRHCESLAKAKEIIDKPAPKEEGKPFERVTCWHNHYNGWRTVEVTSLDEKGGWRGVPDAWISFEEGNRKQRQKVAANDVYPCNPISDELVAQIQATRREVEALQKKESKLREQLKPLHEPK